MYISTSSTSPASLFGGTWAEINGYFLYATKTDVGKTGGSNGAVVVSHTHSASTASAGEHTHTASTATSGSHNHTASTTSAGSHNHSLWWSQDQNYMELEAYTDEQLNEIALQKKVDKEQQDRIKSINALPDALADLSQSVSDIYETSSANDESIKILSDAIADLSELVSSLVESGNENG